VGGFVYSRQDSGLVLAEHGADEAAVARALRQHDPDLRLVRQLDLERKVQVWKVYRYAGSNREAEFLLAWQTPRGEPMPLSMSLVDEVLRHDRNSRAADLVDADTANARLVQKQRNQSEADAEAARDDWRARAEKGRLPVFPRSLKLAAARRRGRRKGTAYS
jgi:hypothetical protein